jgi:hypothetical protein
MENETGEHLVGLGARLVIEAAHLAIAKMDFAKGRARGLAEPEPFACPGTHHPVGEFTPFGIGCQEPQLQCVTSEPV